MANIDMAGVLPFCYPNEFTPFPKFPFELRLKIWDAILAEGRVIEIGLTGGDNFDIFFTFAKLPAMFQISHESRARAFEKHHLITMEHTPVDERGDPVPWLARDEEYEAPEVPACGPLKFLINFDADVLYLSLKSPIRSESRWSPEELWHQSTALQHFMCHLLSNDNGGDKLRRIASDGCLSFFEAIARQFERYKNLKKVHLVFEDRTKMLTRQNVPMSVEWVGPWDQRWSLKIK